MPDPGKTLVDLGTLLGLLSDPDGNFEFSWFASPGPEQNSLEAIYTHPEHLGTLVKDLTPASDIKPLLNGTGRHRSSMLGESRSGSHGPNRRTIAPRSALRRR